MRDWQKRFRQSKKYRDWRSTYRILEDRRNRQRESNRKYREADIEKYRSKRRKYLLDRYRNDPEYRMRLLAKRREKLANDPEYRDHYNKKKREYLRDKCANDPEYRERCTTRAKERKKWLRENDPAWRERQREKKQKWLKSEKGQEWLKKYRETLEYKTFHSDYMRERRRTEEFKKWRAEYRKRPEQAKKSLAYKRDRYAKDIEYRAKISERKRNLYHSRRDWEAGIALSKFFTLLRKLDEVNRSNEPRRLAK